MTTTEVLLTNDDGIDSPAMEAAEEELRKAGLEVVVVAPDRERSASGHAITMNHPLRVKRHGPGRYAVDGTPADCVYLGVAALCEGRPRFVVSGPNIGPNLGTDVFYSGTVAAAAEGFVRGGFGVALSAPRYASGDTWSEAGRFSVSLLETLKRNDFTHGLINVNFPMASEIQGYRWTRLGRRLYKEEAVHREDPKGRSYYWIGGPGLTDFQGASGEDVEAIRQGLISLTPMKMDLTEETLLKRFWGLSIPSFESRCPQGGWEG